MRFKIIVIFFFLCIAPALWGDSNFLSNPIINSYSNSPDEGLEANPKNLFFDSKKCNVQENLGTDTIERKNSSNLILNRPLTKKEIGQISGFLYQGHSTFKFLHEDSLSQFFNYPSAAKREDGSIVDLDKGLFNLNYYYMAEVVKEKRHFVGVDCENDGYVSEIQSGNRFIVRVKISSNSVDDLKFISSVFDSNPVGLFELNKRMKDFTNDIQSRLAIQLSWFVQVDDYEKLEEWRSYFHSKLGTGLCFITEDEITSCDTYINKGIRDFLFNIPNSFIDTLLSSTTGKRPLLRVGLNERFKYLPPEGLSSFYEEKIENQKVIQILQDSIFFLKLSKESFSREEYLDRAIENESLLQKLVYRCLGEEDDSCKNAYNEYLSVKNDIDIAINDIEFQKGFLFYCLQDDKRSSAYVTVNAIKKYLGLDSCEDINKLANKVHRLDLSGLGIVNLDPLIGFSNLVQLNLKSNYIHDYRILEDFSSLKELDLSYNQIEGLYVLQTSAELEHVRLYGNLFEFSSKELEEYRKNFPIKNIDGLFLVEEEICRYYNLKNNSKDSAYLLFLNKNALVDKNGLVIPCSIAAQNL